MAFDIRKYIEENKFDLGTVKKEVGNSTYKGGHNDLRKTSYDVKLTEDGKLDLYTHKSVDAEYKHKLHEEKNPIDKGNQVKPSAYKFLIIVKTNTGELMEVGKFIHKGDAIIAREALQKKQSSNYEYSIVDA